MTYKSYYDDPKEVKKIVEIGRQLITLCEENKLFPKDDELWNAAVTAGNKMVTYGTPWSRFNSVSHLSTNEKNAVLHFLNNKNKYISE